jgi:branched-chain amino acid transport system ATP-binding protein
MTSGLSVTGLSVERGGKPVIHGVEVEIKPGRITALLGANGAGKSSLVLAIAGALAAVRGEILLDGKSIKGMRPENVRRLGVIAVPEGHRVLTDLTVEENLRVAGTALGRRELDGTVEQAMETFPELKPRYTVRAGALSGGQQQMLVQGAGDRQQAALHPCR